MNFQINNMEHALEIENIFSIVVEENLNFFTNEIKYDCRATIKKRIKEIVVDLKKRIALYIWNNFPFIFGFKVTYLTLKNIFIFLSVRDIQNLLAALLNIYIGSTNDFFLIYIGCLYE